jgi:hypothetical protein
MNNSGANSSNETPNNSSVNSGTNAQESTNSNDAQNGETKDNETKGAAIVPIENTNDMSKDEPKPIDDISLEYMNKDFVLECMSIPTHSRLEYRMVTFIILWARRNNVKYEFDDYGNIYITKGVLEDGEYYPCVTSHLDTVQIKHDPYIYAGVPLDLKIEKTKDNEHKVSVASNTYGVGIGADDKGGIAICLSLFDHFEKLKACFFLDEETGCNGSNNLWKEWFNDVGYVIGYDSPDLFRAAYSCSGVKLFSYDFYEKHMKDVCDKWGLVQGSFHAEPFTDVKNIREKIGVICMNFGNGGYNAHNMGGTEYCILEHMDHACGMGIDLIDNIGCERHYLKHRNRGDRSASYVRDNYGIYHNIVDDDDDKLASLSGKRITPYNSTSSTTRSTTSFDDQLKFESVKYIVNRYEKYINDTKDSVLESVKAICSEAKLDYALFEKAISEKFDTEITF